MSQEREAKEKIHILASDQKIKGGSERTTREGEDERSIFGVPLIVFCFNKLINNYNGVNTVFLSYKSCIFSFISALKTGCPAPGFKSSEKNTRQITSIIVRLSGRILNLWMIF
jgi:hypothetical protein